MTDQKMYPTFNANELQNAIRDGLGYTFTFDTNDPYKLKMSCSNALLLQGFRYDLTKLAGSGSANDTKQMHAMYQASLIIPHLWLQLDLGTNSIVGTYNA